MYPMAIYILTYSDDASVSKVMPRNRQEDMGFYTQIVTVNSSTFMIRLISAKISHYYHMRA